MIRITLIVIMTTCFLYHGQAQNGSLYVGGLLGYEVSKIAESKVSQWSFSPDVGVWIDDNKQLGIALRISGIKADDVNRLFALSPVLYFRSWHNLSEKFALYGEVAIRYNYHEQNVVDFFTNQVVDELTSKGFGVEANGGIGYALTDKVSIIGKLGIVSLIYDYIDHPVLGDITRRTINASISSLDPVFDVGIIYTFKK